MSHSSVSLTRPLLMSKAFSTSFAAYSSLHIIQMSTTFLQVCSQTSHNHSKKWQVLPTSSSNSYPGELTALDIEVVSSIPPMYHELRNLERHVRCHSLQRDGLLSLPITIEIASLNSIKTFSTLSWKGKRKSPNHFHLIVY
jgi:hypothetical protein